MDIIKLFLFYWKYCFCEYAKRQKKTPLIFAAKFGHDKVVSTLLEYNATIDIKTGEGWTALMYAVKNGFTIVVAILLKNNACVDIQGRTPIQTALIKAAFYGHSKIVSLLLIMPL